jgi:aldehyde dehydrogenase (NAD+)
MSNVADAPQLANQETALRIGGAAETGEGETLTVIYPATGKPVAEVRSASAAQVERAAQAAQRRFREGLGTAEERSALLFCLADVMEANAEEILATAIAEVGTPISTARNLHVQLPIGVLRWLAQATLTDRTEKLGRSDGPPANEVEVIYRPVGVVAGITAYNYPVNFAAMKAGSAFAAGCPSILLPSPFTPLSTLNFARYAEEAGFPEGTISTLVGGIDTAKSLIAAPEVAKVSFTGSVPAGQSVMQQAAFGIRGVVLELGGKSAALVLPSADATAVADGIHKRYLRNAGQGCMSPTRILVPEDRLDEFVEASRASYADIKTGDPLDPDTLVGPVIAERHRDRIQGHIDGALAEGGVALAKGEVPDTDGGWWVVPHLVGGLDNGAMINQEEIFGPVASVQTYRTVDEGVDIANDTIFGLHTSVFGDVDECRRLAPRFQSGLVTINGGGPTRYDAPNGGWKQSGIGRERGEAGIREYLEPMQVQWSVE